MVSLYFADMLSSSFLDPPKVTSMRLEERTPTSLSLSWSVSPRPRAPRPTRYELTYRKKVLSILGFSYEL